MVVAVQRGFVQALVPGRAAELGCWGTVVVVTAGELVAAGVTRGFWKLGGAAWLGLRPGWGAAPRWRAPWRAHWPVLAFSDWWASGAGVFPRARGRDRARMCQRCASLKRVLRPMT